MVAFINLYFSKKLKMINTINKVLQESISLTNVLANSDEIKNQIVSIVDKCIYCFKNNGKVLFCGNGGSAADAQHLAAELSGKFNKHRSALYSEALHVNSSFMTAVANDFGYDYTYSRMIEAIGREHDILFAISTSGNSKNVINAIKKAKEKSMITIGFLGKNKTIMNDYCDITINIPSNDTARVQESHIKVGHIICQIVEDKLF